MKDEEIKEAVKLLELILLGNLVKSTGIVWDVWSDISKWHFIFRCRYGVERGKRIDTKELFAGDIESLMETRMSDVSTSLIQRYLKKTK